MLLLLCFYIIFHRRNRYVAIIGTREKLYESCVGAGVPWYHKFVPFLVQIESALLGLGVTQCAAWIRMIFGRLLGQLMWRQ